MGKIMAIDYGKKRCGIAVTDDMKIIASGLDTVETEKIFDFLKDYYNKIGNTIAPLLSERAKSWLRSQIEF